MLPRIFYALRQFDLQYVRNRTLWFGLQRRALYYLCSRPWEAALFIHNANIAHYRRLIAESERDPKRDEDRHQMLPTLLAEEIAKEKKPFE
jgi:hypothetical protein